LFEPNFEDFVALDRNLSGVLTLSMQGSQIISLRIEQTVRFSKVAVKRVVVGLDAKLAVAEHHLVSIVSDDFS